MNTHISQLSFYRLNEAKNLLNNTFEDITESDKSFLIKSLSFIDNSRRLEYYTMSNEDKNLVGITGLYNEDDDNKSDIWLGWFCIDKAYRNNGLSKKLLQFTIDRALSYDKKYLKLYVYDSKKYRPAIKLYEQFGFKQIKKSKGYLYYTLELDKFIHPNSTNISQAPKFLNYLHKLINGYNEFCVDMEFLKENMFVSNHCKCGDSFCKTVFVESKEPIPTCNKKSKSGDGVVGYIHINKKGFLYEVEVLDMNKEISHSDDYWEEIESIENNKIKI